MHGVTFMYDDSPLTLLVEDALYAAKHDRCGTAVDILRDAFPYLTEPDSYRVCKAMAEAGTVATVRAHGGVKPDPAAGELWAPGGHTDDPLLLWSIWFLVAHANADSTMTRTLFAVMWERGRSEVLAAACTLLGAVASISLIADEVVAQ
ncbi:hypothetical protein VSR01_16580 [Actinacidiphila sp. DG2A-62]|uniref:hypothetical protein n=1 Tax=Actinacidiphila sp. DG2A-62 TaxID=3108821 RepID=UPI002DBCD8A9|nr:hypothetical protein [Actinacidiphila sp. DG2A-62]MEC3995063.1 hypothetical protein [Actinacidiphila sp. DG2A-62]